MRRRWLRVVLGFLVSLLMIIPALTDRRPELLERFEMDLFDVRLRATMPKLLDPRVVIVDIDEKSLAEVGRWPWSRETLAQLVEQMFSRYQVTLAGFDVVFSEAETRVELEHVRLLLKNQPDISDPERFIAQLDPDKRLADVLAKWPVTLGYIFSHSSTATSIGGPPRRSLEINEQDLQNLPIPQASGIISNLAELQLSVISGGFFDNPLVDRDGVYRRIALLQHYSDKYYPALSLAMLLELFGETRVQAIVETDASGQLMGLTALDVAGLRIPVDEQGAMLVPYRGGPGSFPYVSAVDLLNGTAEQAVLEGAIVFVGTSAAGLGDLRVTPVATRFAGVEVHANALSAMLDERFLSAPDYTLGVEIAQLALTAILLSLLIPFLNAIGSLLLVVGWVLLLIGFNLYAWVELAWVIPIGYTLAVSVILLGVLALAGYFSTTRHKAVLQTQFGQYVPPSVVASLADGESQVSLDGEIREMTVLFSDIRGFTSISEGLSPRQLSRLMNLYLSEMTEAIHQYSGTIDKYIGDAVMAFWGAPLKDADHAQHALEAALAMQDRISRLNPRLETEGLPQIAVGMGLNSDLVNVGNMGSNFRMAYTVLGDGVNLASRLEGLTKFYKVSLLVSDSLRKQTTGVLFRPVDLVRVKGKLEPVEIFEPLGLKTHISQEEALAWNIYSEAIDEYRNRNWSSSADKLRVFNQFMPEDPLVDLYLRRIADNQLSVDNPNWSPVFEHRDK